MGKVIIGIHGTGNKPKPKLFQEWWWKSISEGLLHHTKNKYRKPKFKLVYWADILNDHPKDENCTDTENPDFITEPYEPEIFSLKKKEHSLRKKIIDSILPEINKIFLNDDYSLNFTGFNDLIIKKYFRDINAYYFDEIDGKTMPVKETLRNRLKSVLIEHKNDEILLIAHSMGSIVAFDVLSLFEDVVQINTLVTIGSPLGLPVVISKIANELKLKNRKKGKLSTPASIKNYWYNFSDLEDKVAFNYKLNDNFLESSNGIKVIDFEVTNTYVTKGHRNPHKSYGYLRTPELAEKIYQFLNEKPLALHQKIWHPVRRILRKWKFLSD